MQIANSNLLEKSLRAELRGRWGRINFQFSKKAFSWLVRRRAASVAFHAGSFLRNLDSDARADARRTSFDHRARVRHALHVADVDDHVYFARAIHDRAARFIGLHIRQCRAGRKSNHSADGNAGALEVTRAHAHPRWVHADRSEAILRGLFTQMLDFSLR